MSDKVSFVMSDKVSFVMSDTEVNELDKEYLEIERKIKKVTEGKDALFVLRTLVGLTADLMCHISKSSVQPTVILAEQISEDLAEVAKHHDGSRKNEATLEGLMGHIKKVSH